MRKAGQSKVVTAISAVGPVASRRSGRMPLVRLLWLCVLTSILSASPSWAQLADPFAQGGSWVSLDQFEEQQAAQTEADAQAALVPPSPVQTVTQKGEETLATPVRALDLPVMPANVARHAFEVSSTQEEADDWYKEKKKWQPFEEADREILKQTEAEKLVSILGRDPFKVRFALLPGVTKSIMAERISTNILDREAISEKAQAPKVAETAKIVEEQKKTKEACEAFTEHRRRQLEAMESDRQTLAALQSALSELGLSKELGFMAKSGSSLSSSANASEAAGTETATKMP